MDSEGKYRSTSKHEKHMPNQFSPFLHFLIFFVCTTSFLDFFFVE
jgi:hypothetical protein